MTSRSPSRRVPSKIDTGRTTVTTNRSPQRRLISRRESRLSDYDDEVKASSKGSSSQSWKRSRSISPTKHHDDDWMVETPKPLRKARSKSPSKFNKPKEVDRHRPDPSRYLRRNVLKNATNDDKNGESDSLGSRTSLNVLNRVRFSLNCIVSDAQMEPFLVTD